MQGKIHESKGGLKETAGQVANNPNIEAEGQSGISGGKVQKEIGQIENVPEK
jgi:uncharacterized protein YjbJ (UPF0337 family)